MTNDCNPDNNPDKVSRSTNPCIICGKQPERIETRSHIILFCKVDNESSTFHDIVAWGSSDEEAANNWNKLNKLKSPNSQDWLFTQISNEIARLDELVHNPSAFVEVRVQSDIAKRKLEWVLSLKKPEENYL